MIKNIQLLIENLKHCFKKLIDTSEYERQLELKRYYEKNINIDREQELVDILNKELKVLKYRRKKLERILNDTL